METKTKKKARVRKRIERRRGNVVFARFGDDDPTVWMIPDRQCESLGPGCGRRVRLPPAE